MTMPTRGLALRLRLPLRPHCEHHALPTCALGRTFSSLRPLQAASKPTIKSIKPTNSPTTSSNPLARPVPLGAATLNKPILLQLARSQTPTLLYESASHFWLKLSSWTAALSCYAGSAVNVYLAYGPPAASAPADVAWLIQPVYTVAGVLLVGLGSYFLSSSAGVIKSIRAIPTAALKTPLRSSLNPALTPVHLEVAIKPLLPFRHKPKIITVPPEQAVLAHRLYAPLPTGRQARKLQEHEKRAKKAQWEEDKQRLLTLPFRDAWRYGKLAVAGVRRALTGGGFVELRVDGRRCKLDMTSGWLLNEGRTLEGLVTVEKRS